MTDPHTGPREGYLLLADISGYTELLTGSVTRPQHHAAWQSGRGGVEPARGVGAGLRRGSLAG